MVTRAVEVLSKSLAKRIGHLWLRGHWVPPYDAVIEALHDAEDALAEYADVDDGRGNAAARGLESVRGVLDQLENR